MTTVQPPVDMIEEYRTAVRRWADSGSDAPAPEPAPLLTAAWATERTYDISRGTHEFFVIDKSVTQLLDITVEIEHTQLLDLDDTVGFKDFGVNVFARLPDSTESISGTVAVMERLAGALLHTIAVAKEAGL